MKIKGLILLSFGLTACSTFERNTRSGYGSDYSDSSPTQTFYQDRRALERERTQQELNLPDNRELSDEERDGLQRRIALHRLENRLGSKKEKAQYYKFKGFLKSDNERIYFLTLPNFESRQRWVTAKGINPDSTNFDDDMQKLIENNDISMGMSKKAVSESWGDPDIVEVSGDPVYGNERWKYKKTISTSNGYSDEIRAVYFDAGRVIGWEKMN